MIDAELRALAAYRVTCAADVMPVSANGAIDGLLDERLCVDLSANWPRVIVCAHS